MSNTRIKNKRKKWNYSTAKQRKRNKELCKRYPFLIPRIGWNNKVIWNKDIRKWFYTLADNIPRGWWKAFGIMMCEELREELIRCSYLHRFRILQAKEKYGQLRIYTGSIPLDCNTEDIIEKYSHLSENICITCGKPDVPMVNDGWLSPECFECYKKRIHKNEKWFGHKLTSDDVILDEYNINPEDNKMTDSYTIIRGNEKIIVDISETANAIRERWLNKNGGR